MPQEAPTILYTGHHETHRTTTITQDLLFHAQKFGYDVLTAPVTNSNFQSRVLNILQEHVDNLTKVSPPCVVPMPVVAPLDSEDTDLSPNESNSSIVAVTSSWIDLGSPDPLIAHISRQVFTIEVAYAAFCGVSNILVYGQTCTTDATQSGRAILEAIGLGPYLQLHILMPMTGEIERDISEESFHLSELARAKYVTTTEDENDDSDPYHSWEDWNTIRTVCNYTTKLSVAVELPRHLPNLSLQSRWYSEPIRLLTLPRTSFIRNATGYPVLSKSHQEYLTRFLRLRFPPWILLCDVGHIPSISADMTAERADYNPTPAESAAVNSQQADDPTVHLKYLRHLQQTQPRKPPIERFGQGYQDYMQSPLQPLTDNLESITYEVFEKDPVKYEWYERAVALALKDLLLKVGDDVPILVAVVGAGRGPLVARVLQASKKTGIKVKCWAVEKNPNAYVLLQRRNAHDPLWDRQVSVVKSDMRSWPGPVTSSGEPGKIDILVSELLGSFADNELSPECLDGVQHVLHPGHGISIPQSYSAHLTPISTPRLHTDLLGRSTTDVNMTTSDKWELPYVVMLHQYDYMSLLPKNEGIPNVKEAWNFSHPQSPAVLEQSRRRAGGTRAAGVGGWTGGDGSNEHNSRFCNLTFNCKYAGVCHGLGGYFETVLYHSWSSNKYVELSTNPMTMDEKSKDMISWFPIFFPLKTPLYVPAGADVEIRMWRQTDDKKVWYEWIVEVFESADANGKRRRKVGMSHLHCSRQNGCMM